MKFPHLLGIVAIAALLPLQAHAQSYSSWVVGTVKHVAATRSGVLVVLVGEIVPNNCTNSPAGHMSISDDDPSMISFFLSYLAQGRREFYFYTDASTAGYCQVNQIHLAGPL